MGVDTDEGSGLLARFGGVSDEGWIRLAAVSEEWLGAEQRVTTHLCVCYRPESFSKIANSSAANSKIF
jgi:hypothetical protein